MKFIDSDLGIRFHTSFLLNYTNSSCIALTQSLIDILWLNPKGEAHIPNHLQVIHLIFSSSGDPFIEISNEKVRRMIFLDSTRRFLSKNSHIIFLFIGVWLFVIAVASVGDIICNITWERTRSNDTYIFISDWLILLFIINDQLIDSMTILVCLL